MNYLYEYINKFSPGMSNDKESINTEIENYIRFDKNKTIAILNYFKNTFLTKNINFFDKNIKKISNSKEEIFKSQVNIKDIIEDNRYNYYFKKMRIFQTYPNKEILRKYICEKIKAMKERCQVNMAENLESKEYIVLNKDNNEIQLKIETKSGEITTCRLNRVKEINYHNIGDYDKGEFEYAVYKFDDDLVSISNDLDLSMSKTILIYYANHSQFKITDTLCEIVAIREWCEDDKLIFAECYKKYGRKLDNYFNYSFKDFKTELDLQIYYFYYNNKIIGEAWSPYERGLFQFLFQLFRKDWIMYTNEGIEILNSKQESITGLVLDAFKTNKVIANVFEDDTSIVDQVSIDDIENKTIEYEVLDKTISDIKNYYNNYYKKLTYVELEHDIDKYKYEGKNIELRNSIIQKYCKLNRKIRKKKILSK